MNINYCEIVDIYNENEMLEEINPEELVIEDLKDEEDKDKRKKKNSK